MSKSVQVGTFYSPKGVVAEFFPCRSARWVKETFKGGGYGRVLRDAAGWMISVEAVAEYQRRNTVGSDAAPAVGARRGQLENLKRN